MFDARAYEHLGQFYLGRSLGEDGSPTDEPVLYDSRDLTTHGVCLGMTGSGKTGLCVSLLEEAAIDGVPAIVIDPKGDLGNLLLTFPELRPEDFLPWIDPGAAARAGRTPEEQARHTAESWRKGLLADGQTPERIARLRDSVEMSIYTPGSDAGRPLTILRSFAAPSSALAGDALRERVQSSVSGLLALLGIDPDPLKSREHILIANVLEHAWADGRSLELGTLIREVQKPPFESVGVFDLETFFPAAERMELAMTLNNLLASPGFAAWREGEPLDVGRLLHTDQGRPRLSILSIAHLSDAERMFFVTLLLSEVVAWMRTQSGTQSLRAILYMDEVAGYLPPVANPPSKGPLLTLLKQARAFGVGVMLATQNPVDLDYKALSNAGTWLLGRLQTERDLARVLDGLDGASSATGAALDRGAMERLLAGLGTREFLLHDVHEEGPRLLRSRFALSYLRGPLTRAQIRELAQGAQGGEAAKGTPASTAPATLAKPAAARASARSKKTVAPAPQAVAEAERPVLGAGIEEVFAAPLAAGPRGARLLYVPHLLGEAHLHYANARAGVDHWTRASLLAPVEHAPEGSPWADAPPVDPAGLVLEDDPRQGAAFADLAAGARRPKTMARYAKMLGTHLYRERPLMLWKSRKPKLVSEAGESEGDFRARLLTLAREARDLKVAKLRKRYAPKVARLEARVARAEDKVEREQEQYDSRKRQTVISVGSTILGALFGRKSSSVGRATTAARGAERAARERGDVRRAQESLEDLQEELAALETEVREELAAMEQPLDPAELPVEELLVRARKSEIDVERCVVAWIPHWVDGSGSRTSALPSA